MANKETEYTFQTFKIHYFNKLRTDFFELNYRSEDEILENQSFHRRISMCDRANNNSITSNKKYDLIIGIAMYSEDFNLINDTLEGISKNLKNLNKSGIPNEKILIVIISDGRVKINNEVFASFIGNNLEGKEKNIDEYMKNEIFSYPEYNDSKPNYLISCLIKRNKIEKFENGERKNIQMDILFSIKKENKGKLDSHYWLFMGFCRNINPEYIILLDTGTIPDENGKSLCSLILPMKNDESIAGTCGEMELSNDTNSTNFTLCAQFLEYKYAHVVDKNFESLFGFISVLPGAFSAYRWKALNNNSTLSEYFRTIDNGNANCAMANRYLAEDRIFCWILFSLKDESYILKYLVIIKFKYFY